MRRFAVMAAQIAALALVCSFARRAAAQIEPLVMLRVDRCDDLSEAEVRRIVNAELGAAPASARGPGVTEVTVECDASRVVIRVSDPLTRKGVQRSFDLSLSDSRARGRLVAIAATELVLASWSELGRSKKLEVEPEGPTPPPAATTAARRVAERREEDPYEPRTRSWYDADTPEDRMFRVVALASMRAFFAHPGALWGGGVRIGEERFRFLGWSLDMLFERGAIGEPGSRFDAFTTTVGGALFAAARSGPVTGRIGAGLRAGIAGASPGPQTTGTSTLAPWGWPLGTAAVTFRLGSSIVLDLSGEAGYVVLAGPNDLRLRGGWFSGQLGLGFLPGGKGALPGVEAASAE
jgi:hypothetical protein